VNITKDRKKQLIISRDICTSLGINEVDMISYMMKYANVDRPLVLRFLKQIEKELTE
jgi:hypothetical protein